MHTVDPKTYAPRVPEPRHFSDHVFGDPAAAPTAVAAANETTTIHCPMPAEFLLVTIDNGNVDAEVQMVVTTMMALAAPGQSSPVARNAISVVVKPTTKRNTTHTTHAAGRHDPLSSGPKSSEGGCTHPEINRATLHATSMIIVDWYIPNNAANTIAVHPYALEENVCVWNTMKMETRGRTNSDTRIGEKFDGNHKERDAHRRRERREFHEPRTGVNRLSGFLAKPKHCHRHGEKHVIGNDGERRPREDGVV